MRFLLTDQNIFDLLIYNRQLQKQPKARQMQYSQMISLLANNFILDDSPELKEVGRGCLYALCYEVIYQHRIKILNKDFIPMVLSIMKAQLKVNSEDQLLLFLGAKIFMTEQNQNEKRIVRQTLFDIINRYNHPQIPSFSKKNEYQQDSFEQDYEYNQHEQKKYTPRQIICQNNQNVFAVQGSFMQAYFPRILAQMKGKIDPQKEKILNYLASIKIPKTLLSQFCQFCKNELKQNPIYNLNKQGQMYHVDAVLIFDNRYTSFVPRKYEYSAKFANLNRAQNHAALGLLQQAFIDYPQSLTQFTNKKSKMI